MKMRHSCISSSSLLKILLFIIILLTLMCFATDVLTDRNSYYKNKDFFDEKQDIDVFFLGSSHMELFINPLELYKDYGFTSYNFGSPDEPLQVTYWVLRNALKIKIPKLVVLDVHMFNQNNLAAGNKVPYNLDSFPLSITKVQAINDISGNWMDKLEMFFKLDKLHSRWKELGRNIFENDQYYVKGSFSYGYSHSMRVTPVLWSEYTEDTAIISSDSVDLFYINKIINLCEENKINLLFISTPYVSTMDEQKNMHAFEQYALENKYQYLNMALTNNIIDPQIDMWDEGHVNPSGMHKVTAYMGSYINDNYDLPDHNGCDDYIHWDEAYHNYKILKYESIMLKNDLLISLMLLHDRDITSYVFCNSIYQGNDEAVFNDLMQNIGRHNIISTDSFVLKSCEINNLKQMGKLNEGYLLINNGVTGVSQELSGIDAKNIMTSLFKDYIDDYSEYDFVIVVVDNDSQDIKLIKGYNRNDNGYIGNNIYSNIECKYLF